MNKLMEFLASNPVDNVVKTIKLEGRLKDFELKAKALSGKKYNEFQTIALENPGSSKKRTSPPTRFQELIILDCLVDPNLKDVEFLKKLGVATPQEALYKVFLSGEITQIAEAILKISGFDEDIEILEEEVKNS